MKKDDEVKTMISTRVFFYPHKSDCQIVISDIDGTVTKSDVLGHILPKFKYQWAHENIAEFCEEIIKHGYLLIFITARPITS